MELKFLIKDGSIQQENKQTNQPNQNKNNRDFQCSVAFCAAFRELQRKKIAEISKND